MSKTYYDSYPTVAVAEPLDVPPSKSTSNLALPKNGHGPILEKQLGRLLEQGYTQGLAESLNKTKEEFGQRVRINMP